MPPSTASPFLPIDGLVNFRDLGGVPTPRGVVRTGRIYRSDGLDLVSDVGRTQLEALGCATIFDLRTSAEVASAPGPWAVVHLPLHEELDLLAHPSTLAEGGRDAGVRWLQSFYELMLEAATDQFAAVFETLAREERLPAIVHCAGGKDRTGITSALLLSALGVPREVVLDDFALQPNGVLANTRAKAVHARFVASGIEAGVADGLLSAPRGAMTTALHLLDERFGGIDTYLVSTCGVARRTIDAVRRNLVDG